MRYYLLHSKDVSWQCFSGGQKQDQVWNTDGCHNRFPHLMLKCKSKLSENECHCLAVDGGVIKVKIVVPWPKTSQVYLLAETWVWPPWLEQNIQMIFCGSEIFRATWPLHWLVGHKSCHPISAIHTFRKNPHKTNKRTLSFNWCNTDTELGGTHNKQMSHQAALESAHWMEEVVQVNLVQIYRLTQLLCYQMLQPKIFAFFSPPGTFQMVCLSWRPKALSPQHPWRIKKVECWCQDQPPTSYSGSAYNPQQFDAQLACHPFPACRSPSSEPFHLLTRLLAFRSCFVHLSFYSCISIMLNATCERLDPLYC